MGRGGKTFYFRTWRSRENSSKWRRLAVRRPQSAGSESREASFGVSAWKSVAAWDRRAAGQPGQPGQLGRLCRKQAGGTNLAARGARTPRGVRGEQRPSQVTHTRARGRGVRPVCAPRLDPCSLLAAEHRDGENRFRLLIRSRTVRK